MAGTADEAYRFGDVLFDRPLGVSSKIGVGRLKGSPRFNAAAVNLDEFDPEQCRQEIACLRSVRHPCILPLEAVFARGRFAYELYPYCDLGTAARLLATPSFSCGLPEKAVALIARALCAALQYLHERRIVHRSIRASNVVLDRRKGAYLAGMRHAVVVPRSTRVVHDLDRHDADSLLWAAPEVLAQDLNGYDTRSDVYSLGITLIEMANGFPPFSDMERLEMLYEKMRGTTPRLLDASTMPPGELIDSEDPIRRGRSFSPEFHDMTELCLIANVADRPPISELKSHLFLTRKSKKTLKDLLKGVKLVADDELGEDEQQEMMDCGDTNDWSF